MNIPALAIFNNMEEEYGVWCFSVVLQSYIYYIPTSYHTRLNMMCILQDNAGCMLKSHGKNFISYKDITSRIYSYKHTGKNFFYIDQRLRTCNIHANFRATSLYEYIYEAKMNEWMWAILHLYAKSFNLHHLHKIS